MQLCFAMEASQKHSQLDFKVKDRQVIGGGEGKSVPNCAWRAVESRLCIMEDFPYLNLTNERGQQIGCTWEGVEALALKHKAMQEVSKATD
jgi:hypothetical protein